MEVILREPPPQNALAYKFWYLLRDGDTYFLNVRCEQSAVGFVIMVQLTPDEYTEYHALGWTFLHYFASKISNWPRRYSARQVSGTLRAAAEAAIGRSG